MNKRFLVYTPLRKRQHVTDAGGGMGVAKDGPWPEEGVEPTREYPRIF